MTEPPYRVVDRDNQGWHLVAGGKYAPGARAARAGGRRIMAERMIDHRQAEAIQVLHGKLGRPLPEVAHLTHEQAGDMIMALRAELAEAGERANRRPHGALILEDDGLEG